MMVCVRAGADGPARFMMEKDAIYFEGLYCENDACDWPAIYVHDFTARASRRLAGKGYSLLGISPDSKSILVSEASNLYTMRISDGQKILLAGNLYDGKVKVPGTDIVRIAGAGRTALWKDTGEIFFVGWNGENKLIYSIQPDGGGFQPITSLQDCFTHLSVRYRPGHFQRSHQPGMVVALYPRSVRNPATKVRGTFLWMNGLPGG